MKTVSGIVTPTLGVSEDRGTEVTGGCSESTKGTKTQTREEDFTNR